MKKYAHKLWSDNSKNWLSIDINSCSNQEGGWVSIRKAQEMEVCYWRSMGSLMKDFKLSINISRRQSQEHTGVHEKRRACCFWARFDIPEYNKHLRKAGDDTAEILR